MRITFQHQEASEVGKQNRVRQGEVKNSGKEPSCGAVFQPDRGRNGMNGIIGRDTGGGKGRTLTQLQQEAANTDAAIMQDYRTVMANTLSAEDYARLEEDGFRFGEMDPETAVTIVDKIKAELARSGQNIAGYTDDLDRDTLAAALGSETLAAAVAESFREADVPLTKENIEGIRQAWDMASKLETPTEETCRYMVDNEMEPEIWDYYLAQNSGTAQSAEGERFVPAGRPKFYEEDVRGYYMESAGTEELPELSGQIDKILLREGMELNEENRFTAGKLLAQGLPLTRENVLRLQELESVSFPVEEEPFARAAATAVADGKQPVYANLADTESVYQKAGRLLSDYQNLQDVGNAGRGQDAEELSARRLLEEVRLRMTAEVNVKLIRSGFAIDTAPMEELVEALRSAEKDVAERYFPDDAEAVSKYEMYQTANGILEELPGLPAQLLGRWSAGPAEGVETADDSGNGEPPKTLPEFYAEGKALQAEYEKAQAEYETLMTAPRKDLGDNIRKAFANVDAILTDLGLDPTEANRRAVRILGYNRMTVDPENIDRVKAADAQVQSLMRKMTPASTLQMIRDGVNPLEAGFDELEQYFDGRHEDYEESAESYSRFLYGLEQRKEISPQEREAYIGIYRMLHQIDVSDGAAAGALVNTGAELHFANLLSAVRSGKFKSMDVAVSEDLGVTVERILKGESISDQIAKGFVKDAKELMTNMSNTKEAQETYRQTQLDQIRQASLTETESEQLLLKGEMPVTAENLLAAQALSDRRVNPFREWKEQRGVKERAAEEQGTTEEQGTAIEQEAEKLLESLSDRELFRENYQELISKTDQEVQKDSLAQADRSMDVRSLKLLHKQLTLAGKLAGQEDYIFPMYIGEELARVRLTLDRAGEDKGSVRITADVSEGEQLEAYFHAQNGEISGFLVGNTKETVMKLKKAADIFNDSVQENTESDWKVRELTVTDRQQKPGLSHRTSSVNREVPDGEENDREVDNTELYRIARIFLRAVQK